MYGLTQVFCARIKARSALWRLLKDRWAERGLTMPSTMKAEKPPARSAICSASLAERLAAPDTLVMPPEARICQQRGILSAMQAERGLLRCLQRICC